RDWSPDVCSSDLMSLSDPPLQASSPSEWDADAVAVERLVRADEEARRGGLSRRAFLAGAAAAVPSAMLLGSGIASAGTRPRTTTTPVRGSGSDAFCALPPEVIARVKNGWDPERSCQLLL